MGRCGRRIPLLVLVRPEPRVGLATAVASLEALYDGVAEAGFGHLLRVTSAAFADDWSAAEREACALVQLRPNSPAAQLQLGTTLAGAGKNTEALKALDESVKLAPNSHAWLTARMARSSPDRPWGNPR